MAKKPSIEKAFEWTSEILEERIVQSIDTAIKELEKAKTASKAGKKLPGRFVRPKVKDYIGRIKSLKTQIKKLRRGLGGVILTDPEYYKETGLFKKIAEKIGNPEVWTEDLSEALANELGNYGGRMADTAVKNKFNPAGKVGHHRTALSALRDAIEPLDVDVRAEFKRLALADGYKVGEEFIDYIDPAAHKRFTQSISGAIADKLKYTNVSQIKPKDAKLFEALAERAAHAAAFGEESGFFLPKELFKKGASADEVYKYAKPYLELSKRGADAGLQLDEILTSNRWNTSEDLFKIIQAEMPLQDTTPILNRMRVDLLEAGLLDPKTGAIGSELKAAVKNFDYGLPGSKSSLVPDLPKAGLSVEDVYKNVWEPVDVRGLRGLTKKMEPVTEAGVELYSGLPLGTVQDHIETAKDVGKALVGTTRAGRLVRGGLAAVPLLGVGIDAAVAGHAWHRAKKDPSVKNIGAALGESAILIDQATPFGAVGQMANQVIRQYTDPERGDPKIRGRYGAKKAMEAERNWKAIQERSQRHLKTREEEEEYNLL